VDRRQLQRADRVGFFDGVGAIWSGFAFLVRTPRTWPSAAVPGAVWVLLFGLAAYASFHWLAPWVRSLLPEADGSLGQAAVGAAGLAAAVAGLAIGAIGAGVLAPPLAAPALEKIVASAEQELGLAPKPELGLLAELWCGVRAQAVGVAVALPLLGIIWLLGIAIPPLGAILVVPQYAVVALAIAWNLFDYPLTLRGIRSRDRLNLMRRNWSATLGFGIGFALLFAVPCMAIVLLPAAVAGAAGLVAKMNAAHAEVRTD
jgi:CysZ protein